MPAEEEAELEGRRGRSSRGINGGAAAESEEESPAEEGGSSTNREDVRFIRCPPLCRGGGTDKLLE